MNKRKLTEGQAILAIKQLKRRGEEFDDFQEIKADPRDTAEAEPETATYIGPEPGGAAGERYAIEFPNRGGVGLGEFVTEIPEIGSQVAVFNKGSGFLFAAQQ